jgi:hypothetical protein
MRMYVANATAQHHLFIYTLPENRKPLRQPIPPGGQIVLAGNLTDADVKHIVEQQEKYGLVNAYDALGSKSQKKFHGLCYAIDKQITSSRIEALARGNHGVLDEMGKQIRKEMAIVSNERVMEALDGQRKLGLGLEKEVTVGEFDLAVQQDVRETDEIASKDAIGEGFKSDRDTQAQANARRNKPK